MFNPFRSGKSPGSALPVIGDERQLLVDTLHGKHYADALAGRVFSQSASPLGLAIPIYTATAIAGGMPIWNPPDSGVNVEVISVDCPRASGTADFGAIGFMAGKVGAISTASGLSAIAATQPVNGLIFGGNSSKVVSSNAGTVTVTAGVATAPVNGVTGAGWIRTLFAINLEADTGTAHPTAAAHFDPDGSLIVPPGVLVYLACTKASVALIASSIVWKEIPIAG